MMTRDEFKLLTAQCVHLGQIFRKCAFDFGESIDQDMDGVFHIWYKDGSVLHIMLHVDGVIDFHFQSSRNKNTSDYYEWKYDMTWHIVSRAR